MTSPSELLPATKARPRPGEALFGFGLVLDEDNSAPSGTVLGLVTRHGLSLTTMGNPVFQFTGAVFDLGRLAAISEVELASVWRLTLRSQLDALGPELGARAIGPSGPFRVCAACIREAGFISRDGALPWVTMCPRHEVRLMSRCWACHRVLKPFVPNQRPFRCACGREWADAPSVAPEPQEALVQARVIAAYHWIFEHPTPRLFEAGHALAKVVAPRRWCGGYEAGRFWPDGLAEPQFVDSVASVVALLVARNIPPAELAAFQPRSRGLPACLNASCGAGAEWTRSNGRRADQREWYCAFCGSRFLGGSIIGSFDLNHGDPQLSSRAVHRARADLVRWRQSLYFAARVAARGGPASMAGIFKEAKVPLAGYLRAVRLQLVAIVRATLAGEPKPSASVDRYALLDARWDPPALLQAPQA